MFGKGGRQLDFIQFFFGILPNHAPEMDETSW